MSRKFDKYGWNRQFKWHPVSRRHPFPYHLPFVDDFSIAATVAAQKKTAGKFPRRALGPAIHPSDMGRPDKDAFMERVAQKRAASQIMSRAHKKQRLFPHYPQHNKTRSEKAVDAAFAVGLAGAGFLGAAAYLETIGGAGYMARRFAQFERNHPVFRPHLD